jgi:hypothetical protein
MSKTQWINVYSFDAPRNGKPYRTLSRHITTKAAIASILKTQDKALADRIPEQEFEIWVGNNRLDDDTVLAILISSNPLTVLEDAIRKEKVHWL